MKYTIYVNEPHSNLSREIHDMESLSKAKIWLEEFLHSTRYISGFICDENDSIPVFEYNRIYNPE